MPGKGWRQQCWSIWDCSAPVTQEKVFGSAVRTERPLDLRVFKEGKTKKSGAALWGDLDTENSHTGITTRITTAVRFGRLCWLSCACCSFTNVLPEGQQVSLLYLPPHQPLAANDPCLNKKAMLVLDARTVAATWSHLWPQQGIFFFPFFLIKQWQALYAVVRGQWLPELSQESNFQKSEVLNTFNSDFVLSDCKQIYRRSDCILRVILQFFCKAAYNIFPRISKKHFLTIIQCVLN